MTTPRPEFLIKNVRMAHPSIFEAKISKKFPNSKPAWRAVFLLDKVEHADSITKLKEGITKLIADVYKTTTSKFGKKNICMEDGDAVIAEEEKAKQEAKEVNEEYEGYDSSYAAGKYIIFTAAYKAPLVMHTDKSIVSKEFAESNDMFKSGCYVNAKLQFWPNSKWSPAIKSSLVAVQFVAEGEMIGSAPSDPTSGFDEKPVETSVALDSHDFDDIPF